jgi:hypothetical protein
MSATASQQVIEGQVSPGFGAIRAAFEENFNRHGELGGACCVYYRGEKVVDPRDVALREVLYSVLSRT